MDMCEYNQVLNKIYSIIRKNERLCKLLYYTTNVDVDNISQCPNLTQSQKLEVWNKYIKKMLNISAINDESRAYICIKFGMIDFSDKTKRNAYQTFWSNSIVNLHVIVADNIDEINGMSRCLELVGELQNMFTRQDIDAVGVSCITNIAETRVVDGYTSYVVSLKFQDKNSGV